MIRDTSREAYAIEVAAGRIAGKQLMVWTWAKAANEKHGGPVTACEFLATKVENINLFRARIVELRDMGAIEEHGQRRCSITGRRVITYLAKDPPWHLPPRKRTSKELLREALEDLEKFGGTEAAARIRSQM